MKTLNYIILFTLISTTLNAQEAAVLEEIAVLKIKGNVLQAKELAESILQYETFIEQNEILSEMREMYNEVSDGVKKYKPIKNSFFYMYKCLDLYKEIYGAMEEKKNSGGRYAYSDSQKKRLDKIIIGILDDNARNVKDLKKILKSGEMKMNDGERMEIASQIEARLYQNYKTLLTVKKIVSSRVLIF